MSDNKHNPADDLEKAKDEILRKIAEKVKSDEASCDEFAASHQSHASSSKHASSTSH